MITEYLMKPGAWDVELRDDVPYNLVAPIREWDLLVVTPTWVDPTGVSDASMLNLAIYSGPVMGKPTPWSFEGQNWSVLLGTADGLGPVYETPVGDMTPATLSTWVGRLRPNCVGAGSVTDTGVNLGYIYQFGCPRDTFDHLGRCVGAEWRVNPNGNFDMAAPAVLHANYTTPKVVFTNQPDGKEGTLVGYEIVKANKARDVSGYATRVVVAGRSGDGATVALGSANGAAVYNNPRGFPLQMTRLVNAPDIPAANVTTYANQVIPLLSNLRRSITIETEPTATPVPLTCRPGDSVYIHVPKAYLSDPTNVLDWRGEATFPLKLRNLGYSWPLTPGMGIYFRTSAGAYYDVTAYMKWEEGKKVQWQIGSSFGDPNMDPSQMGGAAYLGVSSAVVDRTTGIGQKSVVSLAADVGSNAVANALKNTGLTFPIRPGLRYGFRAFATYSAALASTGSRWTIYCATGTPSYRSEYALTATTRTFNEGLTTYQAPAASNATSAATTGNTAIVEGVIQAGAVADTVYFQFAGEVAGAGAITAKANLTYLEWWQIP